MNRHGGTITATAIPGAGSVFCLSLPLRPLADPPKATQ
jgi:signal transduction histidine kinase